MALVSVTRLHLRSVLYVPGFLWYSITSSRRAAATEGFLRGELGSEMPKSLGFWTITSWCDAAAMKSFRNGGAHLDAMKKLPSWCDESAVLHWEQDSGDLPTWEEAHRRMREGGKLTKVKRPSKAHEEGRACTDRVPQRGQVVTARAASH